MKAKVKILSLLALTTTSFMNPLSVFAEEVIAIPVVLDTTDTANSGGGVRLTLSPLGSIVVAAPLFHNGDGITVNAPVAADNKVTLDPALLPLPLLDGITTTVLGRHGINITPASVANSTIINIGQGRTINAQSDSIHVDQAGAIINNNGNISGNFLNLLTKAGSAINVTANGVNTTINNNVTGILNSPILLLATQPVVQSSGTGLILENKGIIQQVNTVVPNLDAIKINADFNKITNYANAVMEVNLGLTPTNGSVININAPNYTGDLLNNGTLRATLGGAGISINQNGSGDITNGPTGLIQITNGLFNANSAGIQINQANTSAFLNQGKITLPLFGSGVIAKANFGSLINDVSGMISTTTNDAIILQGTYTQGEVTNLGNITSLIGNGIFINASNYVSPIINKGSMNISGEGSGIVVNKSGSGNISNLLGGLIEIDTLSVDEAGILINTSTQSNILNQGELRTINNSNGFVALGDFASFLNDTSGKINVPQGDGILLNSANITGNVTNKGAVTVTNAGVALHVAKSVNNIITNDGTLTGSAVLAGVNAAVRIDDSFNIFNNTKTIQGNNSANSFVITSALNSTGTLNNSGTIQAQAVPAILISGDLDAINNNGGVITSPNPSALVLGNATVMVNIPNLTLDGFTNSGTITNATPGGRAIDFGSALNVNIPLNQIDGIVNGETFLSSSGGNVLTQDGGVFNGNVLGATGPIANTLNFNAGSVLGTTTLGNQGDTVNLVGTQLQALNGGLNADTINFSGGGFTQLDGKGGQDILNVNASSSTLGPINLIPTINVNNPNTVLNVTQPITNINTALNTALQTKLIANANISGGADVENKGKFLINNNISVDVSGIGGSNFNNITSLEIQNAGLLKAGSFTNQPGALYSMHILNPATFSKVGLTDLGNVGNFTGGSLIGVALDANVIIPTGTIFDIVTATGLGATITDNSNLVQFTPGLTSFTKILTNNNLNQQVIRLIAQNNAPDIISNINPTNMDGINSGIYEVLMEIINNGGVINPDILAVVTELSKLSPEEQARALNTLAPFDNDMFTQGAFTQTEKFMHAVQWRVQDVKSNNLLLSPLAHSFKQGMNAGDKAAQSTPYCEAWIKGFGSTNHQRGRENAGYRGDLGGGAIGIDWNLPGVTTIGVVGGYTKADIRSQAFNASHYDISSYQAALYGFVSPAENVFINAVLTSNFHHYTSNRHIMVGGFDRMARAHYEGWQGMAEFDFGKKFEKNEHYFVPYARVRYSRLSLEQYQENNAGGLNLTVAGNHYDTLEVGPAFRAGYEYQKGDSLYLPEIHFQLLYDIYGQQQQSLANLLGGGSAFKTEAQSPGQVRLLMDLGMNVETKNNFVFSAHYELELRDRFIGNTGYLQVYYRWD